MSIIGNGAGPRGAVARLAMATAVALLAACGGGGGNDTVRPDPPPTAPPPPPPPVVNPPDPTFVGHLRDTNAAPAHQAGLTGAGIRIGIVDSGVNRRHPAFGNRVVANLTYVGSSNDLTKDDVAGHGTAVAQAAAGQAFGSWPGGMAPGAQIVSARIISDKPPTDDGSGQGNEVDGPIGLAGIHRDLITHGVRVMNNSWGGLYWTNPNATDGIASEYRPFVLQNDGLVVFAAGNSGFDDPSDMAALPSQAGPGGTRPAASLERGWITVAALERDDPTRLAAYSNACGLAMDYCMAAPGSVVVTGTDNPPTAPDYWRWNGTSLAAPLVSGAAALVWEAFPYFSNDLVRQTLLGTATDLGAPGVDAVFGHGALDAGRAVRGPGRLDWGAFAVDFDGGSSTWGNELSGDGSVVKLGTGTLVLQARAGNTGGLEALGGILEANGGVEGDVRVGQAGRFVLGSHVDGSVDNAGRVDLRARGTGTSRGITSIGGDFLHRDGAVFAIDIGQGLDVAGEARIEGGDLHVAGVRSGYTPGGREDVITAAGGVTGAFERLTAADSLFLRATMRHGANAVWLDITRLDVLATVAGLAGITPASLTAATRVEQAFQAIDGQLEGRGHRGVSGRFITMAGELQRIGSAEGAQRALSSLSGEVHTAALDAAFEQAGAGRRALSARMGGPDGAGAGGGAWMRALGRGGEGGFDAKGFSHDGWLAGGDQWVGNGLVTGFAFGENRAHGRVDGQGDRAYSRSTLAMAHAGWLRGANHVVVQVGSGRAQHDIERRLSTGGDTHGVASRYAGRHSTASIEAGRRLQAGPLALQPYVAAEHTRLRSDGFSEGGAAGFGLRADALDARRSQAIAGLRMDGAWRGLRLQGYGEWQEVLDASGFERQASFVGVDAWAPMDTASAAESGGVFGLGVQAGLAHGARLGLGYDQRFGPRGSDRMVSLRYALGF